LALNAANLGATSAVWLFQISEEQQRVAAFKAKPEGLDTFFAQLRYQSLV